MDLFTPQCTRIPVGYISLQTAEDHHIVKDLIGSPTISLLSLDMAVCRSYSV